MEQVLIIICIGLIICIGIAYYCGSRPRIKKDAETELQNQALKLEKEALVHSNSEILQ